MKTGVTAFDAMTKSPVAVEQDATLVECAKKMVEHDVGSLVVKEKDRLLGIITDEDFVRKVIAAGLGPEKMRVKDIMVSDVVVIEPDKELHDAMKKMVEHSIKHLPVVKNDKLIGILTWKDILRMEPSLLELYIEKYRIRGDHQKTGFYSEGVCDSCEGYGQLYEQNGLLVCESCRDQQ